MKTYGGVEVELHELLTFALDGCEWLASRPGRFTTEERAPGTHWICEPQSRSGRRKRNVVFCGHSIHEDSLQLSD